LAAMGSDNELPTMGSDSDHHDAPAPAHAVEASGDPCGCKGSFYYKPRKLNPICVYPAMQWPCCVCHPGTLACCALCEGCCDGCPPSCCTIRCPCLRCDLGYCPCSPNCCYKMPCLECCCKPNPCPLACCVKCCNGACCKKCAPCMDCNPQCVLKCQTCELCSDFCCPGVCPLSCCTKCFELFKPMGAECGPLCHITCACCPRCCPTPGPCEWETMSWCAIDREEASSDHKASTDADAPGAKI